MSSLRNWLSTVVDSDQVDEVMDKFNKKLAEEKAALDTETRRKVRAFWIGISSLAFVVGLLLGHWFW